MTFQWRTRHDTCSDCCGRWDEGLYETGHALTAVPTLDRLVAKLARAWTDVGVKTSRARWRVSRCRPRRVRHEAFDPRGRLSPARRPRNPSQFPRRFIARNSTRAGRFYDEALDEPRGPAQTQAHISIRTQERSLPDQSDLTAARRQGLAETAHACPRSRAPSRRTIASMSIGGCAS